MARRGERGAGDRFGVEAVRHLLRRVLPDRQRARQRLAGELVAEARLVLQRLPFLVRHQITPRRIWSRSIERNSARKLPSPKPSLPLRWMISKKIGPMQFWVKICS